MSLCPQERSVLLGVLGRSAQLPKTAEKYALQGRVTSPGESLSAKAYVQEKISNKKLLWRSQFHLSAADYNILISVIVSGAKWVSSGWNASLPNTTQ